MTYSTLGPSHHTTEDIGLLRSLPNLTVFSPSTRAEVKWIMKEAYGIKGPVYIRLSNNAEEYYKEDVEFIIGQPAVVKSGKAVTIMVTGALINEVVEAAEKLADDGIDAQIISDHTLKPLNTKRIAELILQTGSLVVVEEHNIVGGLYSAIAEAMALERIMVPNLAIGLHDAFAVDYGQLRDVRAANGLDGTTIYKKIKLFLDSI